MIRQRWSEAGQFRRLSVVGLVAQAFLIVAGVMSIVVRFETTSASSIAAAITVASFMSFVPLALNGMTAWAVLNGSLRARVVATVLSGVATLLWLPQGWTGLVVASVALATIVLVWRHDVVAGATGIRPAQPLE